MAFSGGVFSLVAGNPVVTATTISSAWANNTLSDIATNGLSMCLLKDGSQTVTANIPMSSFKFTGLGAGNSSGDSIRYEQVNGVVTTSGDILLATGAGAFARYALLPAKSTFTATLTGCTTAPTVTAAYSITNNMVQLDIPPLSATSNTTGCTITGLPAAIQPTSTKFFYALTTDNGTAAVSGCSITGGTGTVILGQGSAASATFTNSGTKGIGNGLMISYTLT